MPTQKKIEIVRKLSQGLKEARSFALTSYKGLKTFEVEGLKKEVAAKNGKFLVVKNTLIDLALKDKGLNVPAEALAGSTAVLLNFESGLEGLKSLIKFAKGLGREVLNIKLSFFDGQLFDGPQTLTLSSLPNREVLVGQLLGLLKSPIQRLVVGLKADQRKLVFVLSEITKNKNS